MTAEHLGSCENYNLQMYLSIGECDGSLGPDDMYLEAMRVIFKENKPCHRCAQILHRALWVCARLPAANAWS